MVTHKQDVTQINDLIHCLKTPGARQQGPCAWHVVDRSWDQYVYSLVPKAGKTMRRKYLAFGKATRQSKDPIF